MTASPDITRMILDCRPAITGADLGDGVEITGFLLVLPEEAGAQADRLRALGEVLSGADAEEVARQLKVTLDAATSLLAAPPVGSPVSTPEQPPRATVPALPQAPTTPRRPRGTGRQPAVLDNSRTALTGGPARVARVAEVFSLDEDLAILDAGAQGDEGLAELATTSDRALCTLRRRYMQLTALSKEIK